MTYDIEKTASYLMVKPEELVSILEFFFSESLEILTDCETGIRACDFDLLKKSFHSLKGSSSNFRMESLRHLAADLEAGAASNDLAAVSKLLPAFRQELHSIMEQVKNSPFRSISNGRYF